MSHDIVFSSGAKWKRQRHVINPTFSAAKLKTMSPLINGCITDLMGKLTTHVKNNEEFNIYSYYKRMTMDVICEYISSSLILFFYSTILFCFCLGRCAFGIDTDLQNNPENIYFQKVQELFESHSLGKNWLFRSAQLLPEILNILAHLFDLNNSVRLFLNTRILPLISPKLRVKELPIPWLINRLHTIVEHRQQITTSRIDLLQLMLQVMSKEPVNVS